MIVQSLAVYDGIIHLFQLLLEINTIFFYFLLQFFNLFLQLLHYIHLLFKLWDVQLTEVDIHLFGCALLHFGWWFHFWLNLRLQILIFVLLLLLFSSFSILLWLWTCGFRRLLVSCDE